MKPENQKQEHTGSYYAATVNEVTHYPSLEERETADVCIIGSGFTGTTTALTLAERGYSVAVIEANRVGWGASGRNGGQIINGISGMSRMAKKYGDSVAESLWALRWRGNEIIRERVEKYAIDCDLKDGYAEVAVKPKHLEYIEEAVDELDTAGFAHRYEKWDREQTADKLGTDAFYGAYVNYFDGHIHPLNLCIGEAKAAAGLGVQFFEQSPVTGISHGKKAIVNTADGSVEADAVLIAGNAYSQLERSKLSGLVFPAGSYIIGTEPLGDDVAESINKHDVAVCDLNEVVDYYRLSADKRLLYGGACNYSGRDPKDIVAYIRPRMLNIYPQLKDVRIDFQWGGKIGIVPNRVPTVGKVADNVFYCQGYSGHGVCATHTMGEVMADAIGGTLERYDLFADIGHIRIPGSTWFGNQMIALGMMYYRIKDAL
ncbi:MAG: FAD-binding oxidoreductase [Pseudomonadota bacterium]